MACTRSTKLAEAYIERRAERVTKLLTQGLDKSQSDKFEQDESKALRLILQHREEHDGCSWA